MIKSLILSGVITATFSMTKIMAQIQPKEVSKIVKNARSKFGLPSIAVSIISPDRILYTEIQGVRRYKTNDKVTIDNYYHIGSCSKSVLAVIAAKLIEENKISWDTKFFDVYPELKESAIADYHNITLEDLFLCRAGIVGFVDESDEFPVIDKRSKYPRYDFANWLVSQEPVSKSMDGKFEFNYSNAGYTLASLMLEKVTEKTYEELIDAYIIKEVGIPTFIGFPNQLNPKQPWGHTISKKGTEVFPPEHEYRIPNLILPAGDLSMQPKGFAKYIQLNLKGLLEEDNFLKSESYQNIHFSQPGFSIGVFNGKMFSRKFSGMDGSAGTFFCRAILIPESKLSFTIMTNTGSGTGEMKAVDWITMKLIKKHYNWWWKFWM